MQQIKLRKGGVQVVIIFGKEIILILLMARNVKNIELIYESKPILIAHSRRFDQAKSRLHELNFWKIFTRMPRTNSYSQKQAEEERMQRIEEYLSKEDDKLIVISSFKNTETTSDSITKNFRLHRQKIKRYVSDEDFLISGKSSENKPNPTHSTSNNPNSLKDSRIFKNSEHNIKNSNHNIKKSQIKPKQVEEENEEELTNLPTLQDDQNQSQILTSKRSVLSGNFSQAKTKQKIQAEVGRRGGNGSSSKIKLPELKEEKKYPVLMKDPQQLRDVKAESYIVVEYPSQRIIVSHRSLVSLEIASLTKIMTFYTVASLVRERSIDIKSTIVKVSHKVANITGTLADLIEGEQYSIQELLYGLMLPSGNDAANELAYWGGGLLGESEEDHKALQKAFIGEMNRLAKCLDLRNTKFANPHGLPNQEARSTATDLARLCCVCMKDDLFRTITSCKIFKTTVKNGSESREVQWQNTNKLLRREGFVGLKTGITVTAGPCLAAAFNFRDKTYISVILRAPKISARFKQTRLLLCWALGKLHKDLTESERAHLKKLRKHNRDLDSDNSEDQHQFKYDSGGYGEFKRRCNILNYEL